eukprot:5372795-Amphidinium_carterae.1
MSINHSILGVRNDIVRTCSRLITGPPRHARRLRRRALSSPAQPVQTHLGDELRQKGRVHEELLHPRQSICVFITFDVHSPAMSRIMYSTVLRCRIVDIHPDQGGNPTPSTFMTCQMTSITS